MLAKFLDVHAKHNGAYRTLTPAEEPYAYIGLLAELMTVRSSVRFARKAGA